MKELVKGAGARELEICGTVVALGERRDLALPVSESYSGGTVGVPIRVWRGERPGPTVLVAAAVHGDELNGTGVVRRLILDPPFELLAGSLVLVPVVNVLGFERHSRYMPDRRDLNRSFPGSEDGSLARRYAHRLFQQVICHCDYGIDFHTGAVRRTNFPNVRGHLADERVKRIAEAFGCELVIDSEGPHGSLRRSATDAGCATIIVEAGEVWKIEPTVVEVGLRGVRNVLIELGMIEGEPRRPAYQVLVERTHWVRARYGGLLQFHIAPGDLVEAGQPLATNSTLLGEKQNRLDSPFDGVVLGMTTLPAVTPGEPVCHIAVPAGGIGEIRHALETMRAGSLAGRLRHDMASDIVVAEAGDASPVSTRRGAPGEHAIDARSHGVPPTQSDPATRAKPRKPKPKAKESGALKSGAPARRSTR